LKPLAQKKLEFDYEVIKKEITQYKENEWVVLDQQKLLKQKEVVVVI
jgi:hypothetical protein